MLCYFDPLAPYAFASERALSALTAAQICGRVEKAIERIDARPSRFLAPANPIFVRAEMSTL